MIAKGADGCVCSPRNQPGNLRRKGSSKPFMIISTDELAEGKDWLLIIVGGG